MEFILALLATAVLTVLLGVFTAWAFWLCLLVAIAVVFLGVLVIEFSNGGAGGGDWL